MLVTILSILGVIILAIVAFILDLKMFDGESISHYCRRIN